MYYFWKSHRNLTFVDVYLLKNVRKFWRSFAKFDMIHVSSKIYKLNILDLLEIEHSGPSQRHDNSGKRLEVVYILCILLTPLKTCMYLIYYSFD